jgi:hypothetical protein
VNVVAGSVAGVVAGQGLRRAGFKGPTFVFPYNVAAIEIVTSLSLKIRSRERSYLSCHYPGIDLHLNWCRCTIHLGLQALVTGRSQMC